MAQLPASASWTSSSRLTRIERRPNDRCQPPVRRRAAGSRGAAGAHRVRRPRRDRTSREGDVPTDAADLPPVAPGGRPTARPTGTVAARRRRARAGCARAPCGRPTAGAGHRGRPWSTSTARWPADRAPESWSSLVALVGARAVGRRGAGWSAEPAAAERDGGTAAAIAAGRPVAPVPVRADPAHRGRPARPRSTDARPDRGAFTAARGRRSARARSSGCAGSSPTPRTSCAPR